MRRAGALAAILLSFVAGPTVAADDTSAAAAGASATAQLLFAPPLDRPMAYRVTTRRLDRDGEMISFTLVYSIEWQRAGRGFQLDAVLQRIDSDAGSALVGAVSGIFQPLVGQKVSYLVAPGGSSIDLIDPEALMARVTGRTAEFGAEAGQREAQQMATLLAALPAGERDRLITADIRALVAPANPAIARAAPGDPGVSFSEDGRLRTISRNGSEAVTVRSESGAQPLRVEMLWTVDSASGLVVREQRRSWLVAPGAETPTLVEERVRMLVAGGE